MREEGVIEASTGRGRYAQSTYNLTLAYLESVRKDIFLEAAAGAEGMCFTEILKGHTAISPYRGLVGSVGERLFVVAEDKFFMNDS